MWNCQVKSIPLLQALDSIAKKLTQLQVISTADDKQSCLFKSNLVFIRLCHACCIQWWGWILLHNFKPVYWVTTHVYRMHLHCIVFEVIIHLWSHHQQQGPRNICKFPRCPPARWWWWRWWRVIMWRNLNTRLSILLADFRCTVRCCWPRSLSCAGVSRTCSSCVAETLHPRTAPRRPSPAPAAAAHCLPLWVWLF